MASELSNFVGSSETVVLIEFPPRSGCEPASGALREVLNLKGSRSWTEGQISFDCWRFRSGADADQAHFALPQPSVRVAASTRYALRSPEPLAGHDPSLRPENSRSFRAINMSSGARPFSGSIALMLVLVRCGCSSVVERQLPKLYVVGSIPIARSIYTQVSPRRMPGEKKQ
jgi:hypothetical protein